MAREMKDSGIEWIGEIPIDWKILRNKAVFSCKKQVVGANSKNMQLLSLTTKGVRKKSIADTFGKVPESYDTYQEVDIDDIIICLFDLDCSAVFAGISKFMGMISPAYKILKCNDGVVPHFADYWFRFIFVNRKFRIYAKNLRYTLTYDEFAALPILIPNNSMQKNISWFLDKRCVEIDNVIEKTHASIEEYKKLKQAVITQAVIKGIRGERETKDSGIEWIGEIPSAWNQCKLKNVSVRIGDGLHGTPEFDDNGNVYFINGNNIGEKYLEIRSDTKRLSTDELVKYSAPILNDNTIMIALNGATYGKVSLFKKYPVLLGKSAGYITLVETVCREYIRYYLMSSTSRLMMALSLNGTTIQNLSLMTLNNFPILLPTIEEQWEIVRYLDNKVDQIDALIEKKEQYFLELESFKKSLIYEYITGKKEVPQEYRI